MKKAAKITLGLGITLFLLGMMAGCGKIETRAKNKLAKMNIEYSEATFFECVEKGNMAAVNLFLTAEMNPNTKNNNDETALMYAAMQGYTDIVQALLAKGAEVNAKDNIGWTALILAVERGYTKIVQDLLAKDAEVNTKTNSGLTALMFGQSEAILISFKLC